MTSNEPEWLEEAKRRARYHAGMVVQKRGFVDHDFEDLVQEFLIKLIDAMSTFRPNAKPVTYMERTFRNFAFDLIKKANRRIIPESLDRLMADFEEGVAAASAEPSDEETFVKNVDLVMDLAKIIPTLKLTSRTMIRVIEVSSIHETSRKTGHSRRILALHLRQLREELKKNGILPKSRKPKRRVWVVQPSLNGDE